MKFIVDANVGKLAKWLRMMGYDARFFTGKDDGEIVALALAESRVVLTRDTHLMEWGVIRSGRIKALLLESDSHDLQIRQVVKDLELHPSASFTRCLECNVPLVPLEKPRVENKVPPYVFATQSEFMSCPNCGRIYWRGTHWKAMTLRLSAVQN